MLTVDEVTTPLQDQAVEEEASRRAGRRGGGVDA
jgi:hypothetical protein